MSVTSLQAYQNSGSGKPRYGPPDAPLDSCPLVFARVRYTYEDRDPLTFCVLSYTGGRTVSGRADIQLDT